MRKSLLMGAAAFALIATSGAFAQTTIIIKPEQRTRMHDYVVREHMAPVPLKGRVAVGTVLPSDVRLAPVPEAWGPDLGRYRYVYWNDRVLIVDPASRRIIDVVE